MNLAELVELLRADPARLVYKPVRNGYAITHCEAPIGADLVNAAIRSGHLVAAYEDQPELPAWKLAPGR